MTTNSDKHSKAQHLQDFPTRQIDFQVDTIPEATNAGAYFSSWINTITENYVEGEDNSFNQSLSALAHEQKHRDNHNAIDKRTIPMSLEQYYKICCYDEISATTCELLQLRQEYLAAKTPEDKQKVADNNPKFAYYFNAIKNNTINPESKSPAEFDKEMRFIAVETQNMWMNRHAKNYDKHSHTGTTEYFFDRKDYSDLVPNNANYNKVRQTYMTCGGIDFSKYIDDIDCINDNIKEADKLIAKKASRKQIKKQLIPQDFTLKNITTPQMSLEEYANLQVHKRYASEIKKQLEGRKKYLSAQTDAERDIIIDQYELYSYSYQIKKQKLKIGTPDKPSPEEIQWLTKKYCYENYTSFGTDVQNIQNFYQKYQGNLKSNPKNYQSELRNIYNIDNMDFYPYVPEITNNNLHITNASKKAANNQPVDQSEFSNLYEADIVIPADFRTTGLSPCQQFELARKQMFVENMIAQTHLFQKKDAEIANDCGKAIDLYTKDYAEIIRKDPETQKNWEEAERRLAEQIAKQNKTTLILNKASDQEFKQAMANLNILPCKLDISNYTSIDIDALLKETPIPNNIKEIENSHWYERLGNKTSQAANTMTEYTSSARKSILETKENLQSWLHNTLKKDDTKAPYSYTSYQGEPQYPEWSENKRVSPIQKTEIYDFSSNFLAEQQKELAQNSDKNTKEQMKRDRTIADEIYGRKNSKNNKKPPRNKTPYNPLKEQLIAPADNTKAVRPEIRLTISPKAR